jgi:hypothetical protein
MWRRVGLGETQWDIKAEIEESRPLMKVDKIWFENGAWRVNLSVRNPIVLTIDQQWEKNTYAIK